MKSIRSVPLATIALLTGIALSCGRKEAVESATVAQPVVVNEEIRRKSIEALRDVLWKYASEHKGKMPESIKAPDFPAQLWKSPDRLGSPYFYLLPSSWELWEVVPPMEDAEFGYAIRKDLTKGTLDKTYQVLVGDPRRYILVFEPPIFGDDRFVVTSTGHVLLLKASQLASRISLETEELVEARALRSGPTYQESPLLAKTQDIQDSISAGRHLITALRYYSSETSGCYPKTIENLVRLRILEPDQFYGLYWREWTPGRIDSWIYVSSLTDSAPQELPLLISPPLDGGARVVVFNSAVVEKIDATQFRDWVKKWKEMFKEIDQPWPEVLEAL